MTALSEEAAVSAVVDALIGTKGLLVKLRMGQGLDRALLDETVEAMSFLASVYERQEQMPKRLARALIDLTGWMHAGDVHYDEKTREEIEDASDLLVDLAYRIVGDD